MNWRHADINNLTDPTKEPYDKGTIFTEEQLLAIKPQDLRRWMESKAFGMPNPPPEARPIYGRSTSMLYYKKAISFFMPEKNNKWSVRDGGHRNPTMSVAVNELIKLTRRFKVRKQGKPSAARAPFRELEYEFIIDELESIADVGIVC